MEINLGDPLQAETCFESTLGSSGLAWDTVYKCTQEEELDVQNAAKEATPKVVLY